MQHAAGTMFTTPDGRVLLLRRAGSDHSGEWAFPGGGVEDGESPLDASIREAQEEIGYDGPHDGDLVHEHESDEGVHFSTFRHHVDEPFAPRLNDEHDGHLWTTLDRLPSPMHPGVEKTIKELGDQQKKFEWGDNDLVVEHVGDKPAPLPVDENDDDLGTDSETRPFVTYHIMASDDAQWEETKHPRDKDGKFTSGGGGGGTSLPKSTGKKFMPQTGVMAHLKEHGFQKAGTKINGLPTYIHPSGAQVVFHEPEGTNYSTLFSHISKEGEIQHGKGAPAIKQLLQQAIKQAETKKSGVNWSEAVKKVEPAANPVQQMSAGESVVGNSNFDDLTKYAAPLMSSEVKDKLNSALKTSAEYVSTPGGFKSEGLAQIEIMKTKGLLTPTEYKHLKSEFANKHSELFYDYLFDKNKKSTPAPTPTSAPAAPAPGSLPESMKKLAGAGPMLQGKGYTLDPDHPDLNQGKLTYKKGSALVQVDPSTGKWLAQTPGHMTKEGEGTESLDILLSGKTPSGTPPWKNSSQSIGGSSMSTQGSATSNYQVSHEQAVQHINQLQKYAPEPTSSQKSAISKYSGSWYNTVNNKLRHDHNTDHASSDPNVKHLDEYLRKAEIGEETHVFRGVQGEYAKFLRSIIMEGTKFQDRGFVSTSTANSTANAFGGGLLFKIKVPKGSKGAAIKKWSQHSGENEVLLPRGSAFVVTHYDPKKNYVEVTLDQGHFK